MADSDTYSGFVKPTSLSEDDGKYTDIEVLATRSTCRVLRARRDGRWWVLKCLRPEFSHSEIHRRMLRKEYEVMMRFQHPGIVSARSMEDVAGVGEAIVMEWIDGCTLDDWLATRPSARRRREMLSQILDAVEYIHRHQTVHRDLKPSNIMVTHNGTHAKLIDFGVADADNYSELKQPAGTLEYMAPEQLAESKPDVRNDVYSLGSIIDLMFSGLWKRRVVGRCHAGIDARYSSVAALSSHIRRLRLLWNVIVTAGVLAVIAAIAALTLLMLPAKDDSTDDAQEPVANISPADSVAIADTGSVAVEVAADQPEVPTEPAAIVPEESETIIAEPSEAPKAPDNAGSDKAAVNPDAYIAECIKKLQQKYSPTLNENIDFAKEHISPMEAIGRLKQEMNIYIFNIAFGEGVNLTEQERLHVNAELRDYCIKHFVIPWYEQAAPGTKVVDIDKGIIPDL